MAGWATQVFSREFDSMLARLPAEARAAVLEKITDMGRRMESFPHYRMTGRNEFRLRVGDYRVIYDFDLEKEEIRLVTSRAPTGSLSPLTAKPHFECSREARPPSSLEPRALGRYTVPLRLWLFSTTTISSSRLGISFPKSRGA
jgi:mRNA-degrading endonuclease RelE of RelBE toxin-antitoxin system